MLILEAMGSSLLLLLASLCAYVHVCLQVSVPVYAYMEDKGELCLSSSIALHFETGLLTEPRAH